MNQAKIMTWGALAFAGFAVWYALKKPKVGATGTGVPAYDIAKDQRNQVGANLWQNDAALAGTFPQVIA